MSRKALVCTLVGLTLPLIGLVVWNTGWSRDVADETLWAPCHRGSNACWVEVEAFLPTGPGPHPAVLLLHGVEGAQRNRRSRSRLAREFADAGLATFVVHYFDGCNYEDLWLFKGDRLDLATIGVHCERDAEDWVQAVTAALGAVASRPDIDRERIALDGYSLGGFVALAATEQAIRNSRLPTPVALIVHWAGRFENTTLGPRFPPTLFIHGERDEVVPRQSAQQACQELVAAGVEAELLVIPGSGHAARTLESDTAVLRFLAVRLRRERRERQLHPEFAWTHSETLTAAVSVPFP